MASRELQTLLTVFRARPRRGGESVPIAQMRADFETFQASLQAPTDFRAETASAAGVPVEWIVPLGPRPERTLLFFHGGGYASGSLATHRALVARLARAVPARALQVAYRLAPEHPFPAALEDALAAYRWLLGQGHDPATLALGGDSAGGGLALALLCALRDAGEALPAVFFALSPWTDLTHTGESIVSRAELDPLFSRDSLELMAGLYAGDHPRRHPGISPLFADLRGLPPTLLQVGTAEILHDDSSRLARRLERAGVEVTLEVWDGMFHGWQLFASLLPEGDQAITRLAELLRTRTAVPTPFEPLEVTP
jgi:acetyl esterase/lipase